MANRHKTHELSYEIIIVIMHVGSRRKYISPENKIIPTQKWKRIYGKIFLENFRCIFSPSSLF